MQPYRQLSSQALIDEFYRAIELEFNICRHSDFEFSQQTLDVQPGIHLLSHRTDRYKKFVYIYVGGDQYFIQINFLREHLIDLFYGFLRRFCEENRQELHLDTHIALRSAHSDFIPHAMH